jgi:hypothetical protein
MNVDPQSTLDNDSQQWQVGSMKIKNQVAYDKWTDANKDPYGAATLNFAVRWAKLMENAIADGATMESCKESTERAADQEGITGFMYGCAVQFLSQCWEHGEELRKIHNKEYGKADSTGVVNPAVLVVKTPEN